MGIWSGTSGLNTLTLGVGDTVERPFINKNGTFLAMLHESEGKREAILWSLAEGNEAWRVELTHSTYLLAVNRNGNTLAAADENTLTIFNQNGRQSRSREFNAKIRGLYFTDDDSSVLLILDTTVMKVELEDLSRAITTSYSKTVEDLSFSPDGKLLAATTGRDVNVQDIASGQILASWITAARVNDLCFLASGREILTGDSQNRATVWNWRPEDWIDRACQRLTRNLSELEMQNYLPGIPYRATCPDLLPLSREQLVNEMFPGSD
jgi:WD40 repeat protein